MKLNKLQVTDDQLWIIQMALDMYSRIGIGQFDVIKDHITFDKHLYKEFNKDFSLIHKAEDDAEKLLYEARNILCNDYSVGSNGSWGIYNDSVDDSCRIAFDIVQVIRHEKWKLNPKRSNMTVDSSIHFSHRADNSSNQIKCELNGKDNN